MKTIREKDKIKKGTFTKKSNSLNFKKKKDSINNKQYYIYMIECANKSLYTGITTDIDRRFDEHKEKKVGAKYTKAFKPKRIVAVWKTIVSENARSIASKIEYKIKTLKRLEKEQLINNIKTLKELFDDDIYCKYIKRVKM